MSARLARRVAGTLIGAMGLLLAGCGSTAPLSISASASRQLTEQVAAIRADANADDPTSAARDLATLEASVGALQRAGQLSAVRAASILDAARTVQVDLVQIPTTTTTTTTTMPPPPKGAKHGPGDQGPGGGHD